MEVESQSSSKRFLVSWRKGRPLLQAATSFFSFFHVSGGKVRPKETSILNFELVHAQIYPNHVARRKYSNLVPYGTKFEYFSLAT